MTSMSSVLESVTSKRHRGYTLQYVFGENLCLNSDAYKEWS